MKQVVKLLFKGAILFSFVLLAQGIVFQALAAQGGGTSPNIEAGSPCSSLLEGKKSGDFVCQGGKWIKASEALEDLPAGPQSLEAVLEIIHTITNWVFAVLMAASVIFIMLAGFQFVTEGKDPAKVTEARMKLIYAVGGIAIALAARGFEPAIRKLLGL